jgi:hypothetical protein
MLIFIHNSVVDKGDENSWDDETVVALENLATARREGKHIVMAKRETLEKIAQCSRLSEFSRNIYNKLYNESTQFYSYLSAVTKYIEIVNPCYEPQVLRDSGKEIIKVHPSFFNDSESVQKTILLGENLDDAVFYETIAKVCLRWKRINAQIECDRRGGGGSTISSDYINIQKLNKRFCLCIVDSDKIAPNGNLGSTASRLRKSDDPTCIKTQIFILDCRESENLIPNSILSKLYPGKQEKLEALNIIKSISLEVRCFLDIKEGTYLNKILGEKTTEIKDFWSDQIPQILNISDRINNSCQANWQCSSNSGKCQCQISLGLGDKTLSKTVEYLKDNSPNEIARIVDPSKHSDWEQIGQLVMDWCIAERSIRA